MNTVLLIIIALLLLWLLARIGSERRKRIDFEVKVLATFAASGLRESGVGDRLNALEDACDELQRQAVTPEALDALRKAHFELVERHACLARKTETLPG